MAGDHIMTGLRRPLADRFWSMVEVRGADECWLWTGPVRRGYGAISAGGGHGRTLRSNRVAYVLARGPIPAGLLVRHTCDVPLCCNPAHLIVGTHADNSADRVARGRHVRGSAHPRARLTEAQAARIIARLSAGVNQYDIAAEFGVSQSLVSGIRRGTRWSHLERPKGHAGVAWPVLMEETSHVGNEADGARAGRSR